MQQNAFCGKLKIFILINLFKKEKKKKNYGADNISYSHNYIFIHIPKNAGTSVSNNFNMQTSYHNTVREYIELIGEKKYSDMFSFAFVRNPFSRFLSLYNYARLEESYYHSSINPEKAIYGKHLDYDLLKNATMEEAANLLKEGKLTHNPPHIQWLPQSFWLKNKEGELDIKYLGRFEDLNFHLRNLYKIIGISHTNKIQHINNSKKKSVHYSKLIDGTTQKILEDYYSEDLNLFNYSF